MNEKERRFLELVDGVVLQTIEQWPGELFLVRGYVCLMSYRPVQNGKKDFLHVRWGGFWSVFESEFSMNYQEIQTFLQDMVDKHLNWKVTTPHQAPELLFNGVDEHLNFE